MLAECVVGKRRGGTEIRLSPSSRCRGTIVIGSFSARKETSKGVRGPTPVCGCAAVAISVVFVVLG